MNLGFETLVNKFRLNQMNFIYGFSLFLLISLPSALWSQDEESNKSLEDIEKIQEVADSQNIQEETKADAIRAEDTVLSNSTINFLDNIDIIGDGSISTMYIFWDQTDLSADLKEQMTSRDLASDDFYMQNIDREEFEEDKIHIMFQAPRDRKKKDDSEE